MDYRRALEHLNGLINYEAAPRAGAIAGLSLTKMRRVMALLGDPQCEYQVIHITGTNGKGSTARAAEALLTAMGLRVGLYTSPHLHSPCERIRVASNDIDEHTFGRLIGDVADYVDAAGVGPLSWFETVTAAAFMHFAAEAVQAAVVEVGMLGEFDATNVVEAQIAVVTNVGLDHTDGASGWWQRIAREKSGIVKAGATAVIGEASPDLLEIVAARRPAVICCATHGSAGSDTLAAELGEQPSERPRSDERDEQRRDHGGSHRLREYQLISNELAVGGRLISATTPRATHADVFVGLHGAHQGRNALAAIVAVEEFFDAPLSAEVCSEALADVEAPGRLEVVSRSPLTILDAAHNQPGAVALAAALSEDFAGVERRFLVFGMQDGRDPTQVLAALDVASFDVVVACTAPTARGVDATTIRDAAVSLGADAQAISDVATAVDYALNHAEDQDLLLVAGSVTVLEAARASFTAD